MATLFPEQAAGVHNLALRNCISHNDHAVWLKEAMFAAPAYQNCTFLHCKSLSTVLQHVNQTSNQPTQDARLAQLLQPVSDAPSPEDVDLPYISISMLPAMRCPAYLLAQDVIDMP
jgi:hypothetical protein